MGNKKGRARRNHKPNNWRAMRAKKKANLQDLNESELHERHEPETYLSENQTNNCVGNEMLEVPIDAIKRERMSIYEDMEIDSEENDFHHVWLDEIDDTVVTPENELSEPEFQDACPLSAAEPSEDDAEEDGIEDITSENLSDIDDGGFNEDSDKEDDISDSDAEDTNIRELFGRRIFDAAALFKEIERISKHSRNCGFMKLLRETKKGLNSVFKFQCKKCGFLRTFQSSPHKPGTLSLNQEAVLGINLIGSGFYHLQEFLSNIGVPCMSSSNYEKISNIQQRDWYDLAKESALDALEEEIDFAKAAGEVDSKRNALLSVICDGGWGKRSYGKKFNSSSGCAVLVGVRTKKVTYFGHRNKYCHICKIAEKNGDVVRDHACNINYRGASSGMEADIILEGFLECERLGGRFHKFIADGDSSTYKILRDFRIYKNPDLMIQKLECVNHLCRNFRTKFNFLGKMTTFNVKLRKHVKPSKGNDICKGVKSAARYWRESTVSLSEKISKLEDDIMNAPAHYFGVHTHCKEYFCTKSTSQAALDNLELLKSDGLFYEVLNLCQSYFAANVTSLLENHTNNAAEQFNNIVAKYLGGKRINYSLGRSYAARVAISVVQYNSGGHASSQFRKFVLGDSVESSTLQLENARKRKVAYNATKPRDRRPKETNVASGYHHGFGSEDVDMTPEQLEKSKKIFLEKIKKRQDNRKIIQKQTIGKKFCALWHEVRQDAFPAEHFHRVINAIKRDSYTNILQEILYNRSEFGNNAQIKHQRLVEREAFEECKGLYPDDFKECGLFIDKEFPFLCASPFRLHGRHHILNIKCPVKEYKRPFDEVISKIKFFKSNENGISINEKSEWFIELQGQMRVTNRENALLMIWLGESNYRVIEVARKKKFFEENMKEKLIFFYNECMLKELEIGRAHV